MKSFVLEVGSTVIQTEGAMTVEVEVPPEGSMTVQLGLALLRLGVVDNLALVNPYESAPTLSICAPHYDRGPGSEDTDDSDLAIAVQDFTLDEALASIAFQRERGAVDPGNAIHIRLDGHTGSGSATIVLDVQPQPDSERTEPGTPHGPALIAAVEQRIVLVLQCLAEHPGACAARELEARLGSLERADLYGIPENARDGIADNIRTIAEGLELAPVILRRALHALHGWDGD